MTDWLTDTPPRSSLRGDVLVCLAAIVILWLGGTAALVSARQIDRLLSPVEWAE